MEWNHEWNKPYSLNSREDFSLCYITWIFQPLFLRKLSLHTLTLRRSHRLPFSILCLNQFRADSCRERSYMCGVHFWRRITFDMTESISVAEGRAFQKHLCVLWKVIVGVWSIWVFPVNTRDHYQSLMRTCYISLVSDKLEVCLPVKELFVNLIGSTSYQRKWKEWTPNERNIPTSLIEGTECYVLIISDRLVIWR